MNVFGWKIKISVRRDNERPHLAGWFDPVSKEVLIQKDSDDKFATLVHELGHSLLLRLGFGQTSMHRDHHELIVEGFSSMIVENWDELVKWRKKLTANKK